MLRHRPVFHLHIIRTGRSERLCWVVPMETEPRPCPGAEPSELSTVAQVAQGSTGSQDPCGGRREGTGAEGKAGMHLGVVQTQPCPRWGWQGLGNDDGLCGNLFLILPSVCVELLPPTFEGQSSLRGQEQRGERAAQATLDGLWLPPLKLLQSLRGLVCLAASKCHWFDPRGFHSE